MKRFADISVDQDGVTNGIQISVNVEDEKGGGFGYRLAGPKYNGTSKTLLKHVLTEWDAEEIRSYLDIAFPRQAKHYADAKELTLSIEQAPNPISAAVAVIGIAAGVLEHRSGVNASIRFLRAAADAIAETDQQKSFTSEAQP